MFLTIKNILYKCILRFLIEFVLNTVSKQVLNTIQLQIKFDSKTSVLYCFITKTIWLSEKSSISKHILSGRFLLFCCGKPHLLSHWRVLYAPCSYRCATVLTFRTVSRGDSPEARCGQVHGVCQFGRGRQPARGIRRAHPEGLQEPRHHAQDHIQWRK